MYLQTLDKLIKQNMNEDVTFAAQMEMDELKDFHEGNVEEWFKDRL